MTDPATAPAQPSTEAALADEIACEVMAEMLGLSASEVDAESRGAQLIREGIRRYAALSNMRGKGG